MRSIDRCVRAADAELFRADEMGEGSGDAPAPGVLEVAVVDAAVGGGDAVGGVREGPAEALYRNKEGNIAGSTIW